MMHKVFGAAAQLSAHDRVGSVLPMSLSLALRLVREDAGGGDGWVNCRGGVVEVSARFG